MANIYSIDGKKKKTIELGKIFSYKLREDLIKKAVLVSQANRRQKYGANKLAGFRTSAHYHGSSQTYARARMSGRPMARLPRVHGSGALHSSKGFFTARVVPQATKGRKAHPPKPEKNFDKEINKKEKKIALFSAISASSNKKLVSERGHKIEKLREIPLVLEDKFEDIEKTKEVIKILKELGLEEELERAKKKKVRAGKGKLRGRKYKKKISVLIVVSKDCNLKKAVRNIPGFEVTLAKDLNVEKLAPGNLPGRLTIWTESSIKEANRWSL
jgi:large subunit ribosomal protein L4e